MVPASGWYEWKKSPDNPRLKQPYFIRGADRQPLFFAALYAADSDGSGSFVIITAASHAGLADIHDRRPLALTPAAARDWLNTSLVPPSGQMQADVYSLQAEDFSWLPVSPAVAPFVMTIPHLSWPSIHQRSELRVIHRFGGYHVCKHT